MTNANIDNSPRLAALRKRVGGLGQAVRIGAVLWCAWGLGLLLWNWTNSTQFLDRLSKFYGIDPNSILPERYWAAFAVSLVSWSATAALVVAIWRLAQTFIDGRFFTGEAAERLRVVALTGFAATAIDIVARFVGTATLSGELLSKIPLYYWLHPQDLLYLLICGFFLALSSIFAEAGVIGARA